MESRLSFGLCMLELYFSQNFLLDITYFQLAYAEAKIKFVWISAEYSEKG